jgi:hypothetical protein
VAVVGGFDRGADHAGPDTVEIAVRAFNEASSIRESKGVWSSTLRQSAAQLPSADPMASVVPFRPTTVRAFASTEAIQALVRVYQGGRNTPRPLPREVGRLLRRCR